MTWEEIRDKKIQQRKVQLEPYLVQEDLIPTFEEVNDVSGDFIEKSGLLPNEYIEITNYSIETLLKLYSEGSLTTEKATTAFIHRAVLGHQLLNYITEVRFEKALEECKQLDEYYKETGKLKGPLHGIPISLKDNINVSGLASSMGFIGVSQTIKTEDAAIVKLIKDLGGIIICKTNTSSGMMYSETTNYLWGRTLNPFNRKYLNNGGSSGGEAAIAAMKGSVFGIGSDIGGSVRHPAGLNGVFSIKPSFGRIPTFGTESGQPGQESIKSIYGILSNNLSNVSYTLKTIVDSKPYLKYDAGCIPLEYRKVDDLDFSKSLTFAFLDTDGTSTATSPVLRGISMVKKVLVEAGHRVIDWPDTYLSDIKNTIYPFYEANGFKSILKIIEESGEPVDTLLSKWFPTARDMKVSELWELQKHRTDLVNKYLELWNTFDNGNKIDALLVPCSPFPACLKDKVVTLPITAVWNGLDYSASTFPVTNCDISIDKPIDKTNFISKVDEHVHKTYKENLKKFQNGPVPLQLICNKLEEEKCLRLTEYVYSLLH